MSNPPSISLTPTSEGKIVTGDAFKVLDNIRDESIQLVITSPPYNIGKEYERDERMSLNEYVAWLDQIIGKLCSKIDAKGSICWQVGNYIKDGELFPLDYYFYNIFLKNGFKLRNRIIWHFNFGLHATKRLSGRYETLLWFTKSDEYRFNIDPIRVPQKYPGKRHPKRKGDKAGLPSGNPLGKNPSDFWEFSAQSIFEEDTIWEIPNVKSNHSEKTIHPCQFPCELAERCVLAFTEENGTVLDPFVGTGTSVIAAVKNNRKGLGIDKNSQYARIAKLRLTKLHNGTLQVRKLGQPVRTPKLGEKVSSLPKEWDNSLASSAR